MIDLSNLHENWKSFHLANIGHLKQMIHEKHRQMYTAIPMLIEAVKEMHRIENEIKDGNVYWSR